MAEPMSGSTSNPASNKVRVRSSHLKYYIHDSNEALRFQLTGELTEVDLPELNGCWLTAKTILRNRRLIIDLSGLKAVDEQGCQWRYLHSRDIRTSSSFCSKARQGEGKSVYTSFLRTPELASRSSRILYTSTVNAVSALVTGLYDVSRSTGSLPDSRMRRSKS